jgi:threonine synthase
MDYISTRGNFSPVKSSEAIILGMVPRGGLFVCEKFPSIDVMELKGKTYQEVAFAVMKGFLTGSDIEFTEEEIVGFIQNAYNEKKFSSPDICPLKVLSDNLSILELWHGPTAAFKDVALQIMPYFLVGAMKKLKYNREVVILVATSGDTGKAALEGYKDVDGTKIIVFFPQDGVSEIQKLQMTTTDGKNTFVVGVNGNFDDCQNMVKEIFGDKEYRDFLLSKGFDLSSANSINWGRLLPQIVYYFWGYLKLIEAKMIYFGDEINICVPTGNFGNILAAYYAKIMGLPVKKFICASNSNNVLSDFIGSGVYNKNRKFFKTVSPSMDILISSNLERFLFELSGRNPHKIVRWYNDLKSKGEFKIDETTKGRMQSVMYGDFATEEETLKEIKNVYEKYGYLLDTHSAVGVCVYRKYVEKFSDYTPAIVCSTASPYKFNNAVYFAITGKESEDEFFTLNELYRITGFPVPENLQILKSLPVKHNITIKKNEGKEIINKILNLE